jgi:CubicO group peptidase (beta-lactamase class C family)
MTVDTIFDVASLTKPVATATSIMMLVEQGKLRLNDTVGKFIPEIEDERAKAVTIQQLLTHTSGYAPDFDLKEKWTGREGMLAALKKEKVRNPPGMRFVYSDIGFIVLGEIIGRVTNENLLHFTSTRFFAPLGIFEAPFDTHFGPPALIPAFRAKIAPTENVRGQQSYLGGTFDGNGGDEMLRGFVHDPTSFRMGGLAGHAGLFGTADGLARYCQMLLNGGVIPQAETRAVASVSRESSERTLPTARGSASGARILSAQTVAKMTAPYVVSEDGATRGLGWDMNTSFSSNRGELFPLGSFGHTGFTGTSIWIDPTSQTFVVFLSNRVHPDGKGDVTPLRAKVATVVASAIEDTPIEKWKEAEARYNAAVSAQVARFKTGAQASLPATSQSGVSPAVQSTVLNGIDVLERSGFKELEGKRIGLVTNHTGRNLAGKPTIDVLNEAKNLKLVSLFAPEHGIRGELDVAKIDGFGGHDRAPDLLAVRRNKKTKARALEKS